MRYFPGDPVVKNLPTNAGTRFDPWSGKIPHAEGQLSVYTATTEVHSQAYAPQQEKPPRWEAPLAQLEKDCAVTETQHSQREIWKFTFAASWPFLLYFHWQKRVMTEHEGKVGNESQGKSKATCLK